VIAGSLAVVPLWLFCARAFGARAAWLAAALLVLAASHMRLSQDARCYSVLFLVFCCVLVVAWQLVGAVRERRAAIGTAAALGCLIAAMVWLHATALIAALAINVFVLAAAVGRRDEVRRVLALLAIADALAALLAIMPLWFALQHLLRLEFVDRWIVVPNLHETLQVYGRTLVGAFLGPLSPLAAVLYAAALLAGTVSAWRHRDRGYFAVLAMLACAAIAFPLISRFDPILLDRTVLFMLAPLLAAVAAGAAALPRRSFAGLAAALVVLQAVGYINYQKLPVRKEQWREAAALLRERVAAGEPILMADGEFTAIALASHFQELGGPAPRAPASRRRFGTPSIRRRRRNRRQQRGQAGVGPGRISTAEVLIHATSRGAVSLAAGSPSA
jgi:hypothetical protein